MDDSQKISALAEKAVEARDKVQPAIDRGCAPHEVRAVEILRDEIVSMFYRAATPEAWLALRNEVEALRAALKPFADAYDYPLRGKVWSDLFCIADCRNASRALKNLPLEPVNNPDLPLKHQRPA